MISDKEKKVKHDTQLIILSVLILTLVTLSVSYSAFFSVQTQSTIQELKAGDLDVVINVSNTMNGEDLYPTEDALLPTKDDSTINDKGRYTTLTLTNNGNLDADFSVTISYDKEHIPKDKSEDDLIPLNYLNIGIYDADNLKWVPFGESSVYVTAITGLTPAEEGTDVYPILRDVIKAKTGDGQESVRTFKIYVWLDEDTPISEIDKLVYLKLDVKSATVEGREDADQYTDPSLSAS